MSPCPLGLAKQPRLATLLAGNSVLHWRDRNRGQGPQESPDHPGSYRSWLDCQYRSQNGSRLPCRAVPAHFQQLVLHTVHEGMLLLHWWFLLELGAVGWHPHHLFGTVPLWLSGLLVLGYFDFDFPRLHLEPHLLSHCNILQLAWFQSHFEFPQHKWADYWLRQSSAASSKNILFLSFSYYLSS